MLIKAFDVGGVAKEIGQLRTAFANSHALAGVQTKLERARGHLVSLNSELAAFLEHKPYRISEHRGEKKTEYLFRIHAIDTPPLAWSTIVGDCLQNMRSALNYLAWELASLEGEPPYQTAFPIHLTPEGFSERYKPSHKRAGEPTPRSGFYKIAGMGQEAQAIITLLQPFNGRYGLSAGVVPVAGWRPLWETHPLYRLDVLAGLDRHRALRLVAAVPRNFSVGWSSPAPKVEEADINRGPIEDGGIIARYVLKDSQLFSGTAEPELNFNRNAQIMVVLKDGWHPGSWSVVGILGKMLNYIDREVVPRFEQLF